MELEEAIKELESLKSSENAIQVVLNELNNLQKENESLKSYLAKQCLISDYIKFKRRKINEG